MNLSCTGAQIYPEHGFGRKNENECLASWIVMADAVVQSFSHFNVTHLGH